MKKFYVLMVMLAFWSHEGFSKANATLKSVTSTMVLSVDDVYDGNIYLTTQEEVDNFSINYPGVTEITGELRIWNSDITNLSGLNQITSVGYLGIYNNPGLLDLSGLNNLTTISYDFAFGQVYDGTNLNVSGLNGVTSIGGTLTISDTTVLTSFMGFNNLQSVGYLSIYSNTALTGMPQFLNLNSAPYISIYNNAGLAVCNQPGICPLISSAITNIYDNATGCANLGQIQGSCGLPITCGDVYLYSQDDVDNFPTNYGCVTVNGTLYISGTDITNLNTLSSVTSVGYLNLNNLPNLSNASGLNNISTIIHNLDINGDMPTSFSALSGVTSIGGNFSLNSYTLVSFLGLSNVVSIGGDLSYNYNQLLTALPGMINLTSIGGNLSVYSNDALVSLSGLNNLVSINGNLSISYNNALTGISALSHLTSISGSLQFYSNNSLSSLSGLDNLAALGITSVYIQYNPLLSICNEPGICTYLANGGGYSIYNNALGCNTKSQISVSCGAPQNCSYVYLYGQSDVNNYQYNYGCSTVGTLYISGSDITNLNGLSQITSVENLNFSYSQNLASISGLANLTTITGNLSIYGQTQSTFPAFTGLTSIGGNLQVENTSMTHLPSFPALTQIGENVSINNNPSLQNMSGMPLLTSIGGSLAVYDNPALTDLLALSTVTAIDGSLSISSNDILTSLSGLENINPSGISNLSLYSSPLLATCGLPNLCAFLNNGGSHSIGGNATGCADYSEVSAVCNAGCPTSDVYLTTQAEVDAFAVSYPTCTLIPASLYIQGEDITDLTALSNITKVLGSMNVQDCTALVSLSGLSGITAVNHAFTIQNNPLLASLSGLNSLASIGNEFTISNNAELASLTGLGNLTTIGYSLYIRDNALLASISALSGLTAMNNGSIEIYNNSALTNLGGLQNIASIAGNLSISSNASLTSISGLSDVASVQGLTISGNPLLTSVGGLNALASVNNLNVESNEGMTSLGWTSPITEISSIYISSNAALVDMSSLSSITSCQTITVSYNAALVSLSGLSGLTTVYSLYINGNESLTSLSGLSSLSTFSNMQVTSNVSLISLNGLQGLHPIENQYSEMTISGNTALTSLTGFNLTKLNSLNVNGNAALTSLSALSSMTSVRYLYLSDNASLTSLSGLDNLNPSQLNYLSLQSSQNLSTCNVAPICTFLSNGGSNTISGNASGCSSSLDVQISCGSSTQCPVGAITFTSQAQIDQFIIAYPTCTSLPSYVTISGADITNLNGLANITYVANPLVITNNPLLTNLTGLNNLTFVGALTISNNPELISLSALSNLSVNCYNVSIDNNDALTSLAGLQNLPIAGSIQISNNNALTSLVTFVNLHSPGSIYINNNDALTSLSSLGGITSIYSFNVSDNDLLTDLSSSLTNINSINISSNAALASLSSLNGINPNSISGMSIYSNTNLSVCSSAMVCTFMEINGNAYFSGNAAGCATNTEVQVGCGNGEPPTYGTLSPTSVTACDGQSVMFTIDGLVPDSISMMTYTINGTDDSNVYIYSDALGVANFYLSFALSQSGQELEIISIQRVDVETGTLTVTSNNTALLNISAPITYYRDYDEDTFGNLYDTTTSCTGIPSGYVTNSTDCYDYDAALYNSASNVYYDNDQDGYDTGLTSICYGETMPSGYSFTTNGHDCDDYNAAYHERFPFYYDGDQDGYGTGSLQDACAANASTAPDYYSTNNTDCSPFNSNIYRSATLYVDIDGDQYNNGSNIVCYGVNVPAGYSATTNGTDCDDNDVQKHTTYPFYADTDGDGYGTGNIVSACAVSAVIVPVGYSVNNTDCAPTNGLAYQQGTLYVDVDGDHFDNGTQSICYGASAPNGFSATTNGTDCNDNNAAVNSGFSFYADTDGDGYGAGSLINNICALNASTPPLGYSTNNNDCAPTDPATYLGYTYYADNDGDTYGSGSAVVLCSPSPTVAPVGYSINNTDCNDADISVYISGPLYVDVDGDRYDNGSIVACYGTVPSGYSATTEGYDCADTDPLIYHIATFYIDVDGDGYDNGSNPVCYGANPPAGYIVMTNGSDCNDNNAAVHPGAQEVCNGIDDDCDGFTDDEDPSVSPASQTIYYADTDNDSFGNASSTISRCVMPVGYVANSNDCNDSNGAVNPNAQEICNGIDDDCDGLTDGDDPSVSPASQTSYYADTDNDGYGNPAAAVLACSLPSGHVTDNTDCDDANAQLHPGQIWILDNDNDGYGTGATTVSCTRPLNGHFANELISVTGDCNDNNPSINPVAQRLEFSGTPNFTTSLISPQSGTLYTNFTFEVTYYDANNQLPPVTFPRVYLDYEGNGSFNGPNDRAVIMTPFDVNDTNTADGKRYIGTINALAYGTNWQTRVQIQNGACVTEIGPFNYPDVQVQSDLQIFANDITFSSNHPAAASPLTINAVVHNLSDFPAENFYVHLINQFDPSIVYGDVLVSNVAPHASTTVTWNITTPAVPAWCPMQVVVDNTNVVIESDELDNTAIRPFINGNYNLLGGITVDNVGVSPSTSYVIPTQESITVFGRGTYFGTPTPLPDPSVAGATVTFTIVETGASYSTYTNSQGWFNYAFPAPMTPGLYHIQGEMTDYTFIGTFTSSFTRLVYVEPCPTDMNASVSITTNTNMVSDSYHPNIILVGESISGSFTVTNGCSAVGATILDVSQTGGTPTINDINVPAMASNSTFTSNFSNIVFNAPGTYTVCATADGTSVIVEASENNTGCASVTVIQNQPDIYPVYGPGNYAQVCQPASLGFTLYNGGGGISGSFTCDIIVKRDNVQIATLHHTVTNINALSYYSFNLPYTYAQAGYYTFELRCDIPMPNGVVAELNEANNTVTFGVSAYDCVYKADLTIGGCEALDVTPVDPQFPGTVTYVTTVTNSGDAVATGPIGVRFHLSGGQNYDTQYNGSLSPGQSATVSVNASSVASGTQTLTAIADYNNTIAEWSETNNEITNSLCWDFQPVERDYPCGSDFWDYTQIVNQPVYLAVGVNQYNLYNASSVDVKFEVSGPGLSGTVNLGNATLNNITQSCYCPYVAALPYSFVFPEEGTYTFTMTVDPNHHYTECNEGNNVLIRTVSVTHLPDMRVLSQFINPSMLNPEPGQPISLSVSYENIGTTNIQDTMQLSVLVDDVPLASVSVGGLGTGENATVAIPVPWSSNAVGTHIIRAVIDSSNQVVESNESNNEATRAIIVGEAANLHFDALASSNPTPSLGSSIMINAIIGNNGDLDCEADVLFYYMTDGLQEVQIGSIHVSVANNGSTSIQLPWTVLDSSTTILVKIINASVLEFTYDDNEATTVLGGMGLTFSSTANCIGQDNGTLTALPSGGQAPYSYVWDNGYNGATLTASAGTYGVTVTDNTGQSVTGSGNIVNGTGSITYYADADGDHFGNPNVFQVACTLPEGYVLDNSDCDDANQDIHAGYSFYADNDHDGFGAGSSVIVCSVNGTTPPTGYSLTNTDCNDNQLQYLDADNDGYGSATLAACGVINHTDCDDTKVSVHPNATEIGYNLIDDDCDGLTDEGFPPKNTVITGPQCNTLLPAIDTQLLADNVAGAQGYQWKITTVSGPNNGQVQLLNTPLRVMKLTQLATYAYQTTYKVEVAVYYLGYLQPYMASTCTVTTPVLTTKLTNCGQTLVSTSDVIYANIAPFAAGYRFKITDPNVASNTQTIDRPVREFRMNLITAFSVQYGKSYNVEVSVKNTNGSYMQYGQTCTVTMPIFPTTSIQDAQCNDYAPLSLSTPIYATSYTGAIAYVFNLSGNGLPAAGIEITKTTRTFKLSDFPALISGGTYNVKVRLIFNNTDLPGVYGKTCTVVVPGALRMIEPDTRFDAVAYPNPFADSFNIDVTTAAEDKINIRVYDMTGRLLESRDVHVSDMETLAVGDRYPSGVYNVIVTQGESAKTLRVIKR